jgi:hypothetical protein
VLLRIERDARPSTAQRDDRIEPGRPPGRNGGGKDAAADVASGGA